MIQNVTFDETTYQEFPYNFEAGTPNIIGVIAFREALNFINQMGLKNIKLHEKELLDVAQQKLKQIDGLKILGNTKNKASIVTFIVEGAHANDIGMLLDTYGIAVRTGHHCAQPLLACFKVPSTVRSSFAVYNTIEEANYLAESLAKVVKMLR